MVSNSKQRVGGLGATRLRGETTVCPPAYVALAWDVTGKSGKTEQLIRPLWSDSLGHWALILPRHRPLHWPLLPG